MECNDVFVMRVFYVQILSFYDISEVESLSFIKKLQR